MSLVAAALQIATVKALDGAISAKVFASMVDPLQLENELQPVAIVCAVEGRRTIEGRAILEANHGIDLVIDLGVARKVIRQVSDGETTVSVEFPDTDAGHDIILHTLGYEVISRLSGSNDPWPDLWRQLTARASAEPSIWQRGASAENGTRLALIRHVLRFDLMDEPVPGADLTELWVNVLAAMDADVELQDISKLWRSIITTPAIPVWRQIQTEQGLTLEAIQNLGLPPAFATSTDPSPASIEVTISDETGVLVVDADQATFTETAGEPIVIAETADGPA